METIRFAAVSRNDFKMPVWGARRAGLFAAEGLDVEIELHEGVDEMTDRLRDGRVSLACGITEHVVLDHEAGGTLAIIGGNVNKLPFSLIAGPNVRTATDLRGKVIGVSSLQAGSSSLVMRLLKAHGLRHPYDYTLRALGPILARWRMLPSGEIDAGCRGRPLDYIARDAGFWAVCKPREEVPDFQFTPLNVDAAWARANAVVVVRFMRAFVRAHRRFFADCAGATEIAPIETGVERRHLERAWHEYTGETIFPRDGDVSTAALQALIDISALIRPVPGRRAATADAYEDRSDLHAAWRDLGDEAAGKAAGYYFAAAAATSRRARRSRTSAHDGLSVSASPKSAIAPLRSPLASWTRPRR